MIELLTHWQQIVGLISAIIIGLSTISAVLLGTVRLILRWIRTTANSVAGTVADEVVRAALEPVNERLDTVAADVEIVKAATVDLRVEQSRIQGHLGLEIH